MTITATAPVPAQCRLSTADTLAFPRLDRLAVLDAVKFYGLTAYEAFRMGARIRTETDVEAVAATMPPLTPAQIADLDRWCAEVAVTPVRTIAEWYGCAYATAEHVRKLMGDGVVRAEQVDRAVSALGVFGVADRDTADAALSTWAHRDSLTSAERGAVLATFPAVTR